MCGYVYVCVGMLMCVRVCMCMCVCVYKRVCVFACRILSITRHNAGIPRDVDSRDVFEDTCGTLLRQFLRRHSGTYKQ
jgi:hypothetical protein